MEKHADSVLIINTHVFILSWLRMKRYVEVHKINVSLFNHLYFVSNCSYLDNLV